ncbi:MAG: hypothetical protein H7Z40_14865 [Phycisphaerae bacterium]|nr:hypothetical protein [Gemmatimonadaceae bacterium]
MNNLRTLVLGVTLLALPAAIMAQGKPVTKPTVSAEAAGTVAPAAPSASNRTASKSAIPTSITISRETFDYARTGRRDPYKSLMTSSDVRPLISDLKLMSVAYDSSGLHSVAVLRDINTKERYMLKVGQQLGRLRVTNIKHKSVVFSIDEFGFNRQETLQMGSDTTKARTP